MGLGILILSITIATNFSEHLNEGLNVVPLYIHLPFQLLFPLFLFIVAVWKKKRREKSKGGSKNDKKSGGCGRRSFYVHFYIKGDIGCAPVCTGRGAFCYTTATFSFTVKLPLESLILMSDTFAICSSCVTIMTHLSSLCARS